MSPSTGFSDTFSRAVEELRAARPRKEITISEVRAPRRLAPFAHALGATVVGDVATRDEVAEGRLILLYDPAGQAPWRGSMRLVTYVVAEVEPELATDPLLPPVGWSWLTDALEAHGAGHTALAGTVTQSTSTRFGELAAPAAAQLEIRASWTPTGPDLTTHALAWCGLLASTAGLPPPGVSALPGRRMGVA